MMRKLALCLAFASTVPCFASLWDLLPKHEPQVITTTDFTEAGALLPPASKENPVYYLASNLGYRDFGSSMGGDKLPDEKAVLKLMVKTLKKQGYLPASSQHPPTQFLVLTWGTMYASYLYLQDPRFPAINMNYSQRLAFLGGASSGLKNADGSFKAYENDQYLLKRFDATSDDLSQLALEENLYVMALGSFDFASMKDNKPVQLWKTHIACPSRGLVMDTTMLDMVLIAAPNIGHPTKGPVWVDASDKFKDNVTLGTPEVKEYLQTPKKSGGEETESEKSK